MQQFCKYGSVRGAAGDRRPYRDPALFLFCRAVACLGALWLCRSGVLAAIRARDKISSSISILIFACWSCKMVIYIRWWSHVQIQYR